MKNPDAAPKKKARCGVHIDGFNCYFRVFRYRPEWKWLNVQSFYENLRSSEEVIAIKYFTAIVEPKKPFSETRERQMLYLNALKTLPKLTVILGKYQAREVRCLARCGEVYNVPEEKKTDVNIAVRLIDDAVKGAVDSMVLVSGDSDIEPAVQWVRENHPVIKVTVYIPTLAPSWERGTSFYKSLGVACRDLPLGDVQMHLFPEMVPRQDGSLIQRPALWVAGKQDTGPRAAE